MASLQEPEDIERILVVESAGPAFCEAFLNRVQLRDKQCGRTGNLVEKLRRSSSGTIDVIATKALSTRAASSPRAFRAT